MILERIGSIKIVILLIILFAIHTLQRVYAAPFFVLCF